jgi:hypothetical protein
MAVRSIEVTSIEARRFSSAKEAVPQQVRIDHNSTVTLIQKNSPKEATVDFRYTASFGNLGIIKLEGKAVIDGDADTLQASWEATRQMPNEIASQIHTAVMRVCVPEAVFLARDLQLPPPIPLPAVQFQKPAGQSKPGDSPEVH